MLTKEDLQQIGLMIKDLKKDINRLDIKMTEGFAAVRWDTTNILDYLQTVLDSHDLRISRVEDTLDLPPIKN